MINNAFLTAPTHRGIRHFLLRHSANLTIVDLHGDSRKGEAAPDGTLDENVFEIQQGVCIILSGKRVVESSTDQIGKADIFGSQQHKYEQLSRSSAALTVLDRFSPQPLLFFFRRSQESEASPYALWTPISDIFVNSNTGIQTKNDELFTDISARALSHRMSDVLTNVSKHRASICAKYGLVDSAGWKVSQLESIKFEEAAVHKFLYKPFDHRFIYYNTKALGRARHSTMQYMLKPNLALVATRQVTRLPFCHAFVSRWPIEEKTGSHDRTTQLFPLYLYSETGRFEFSERENGRQAAFSPSFISRASDMLRRKSADSARHQDRGHIDPEHLFCYIYSILYSPRYRERFGLQLMGDFPRIPLTEKLELFRSLAELGEELVALHLLESPKVDNPESAYAGPQNPEVEKISYTRDTCGSTSSRRADFVACPRLSGATRSAATRSAKNGSKTAKAARSRKTKSSTTRRIVAALRETIRLMAEIDKVIEAHGGWPNAFITSKD